MSVPLIPRDLQSPQELTAARAMAGEPVDNVLCPNYATSSSFASAIGSIGVVQLPAGILGRRWLLRRCLSLSLAMLERRLKRFLKSVSTFTRGSDPKKKKGDDLVRGIKMCLQVATLIKDLFEKHSEQEAMSRSLQDEVDHFCLEFQNKSLKLKERALVEQGAQISLLMEEVKSLSAFYPFPVLIGIILHMGEFVWGCLSSAGCPFFGLEGLCFDEPSASAPSRRRVLKSYHVLTFGECAF
ncbi:uncharacterized protein G2W53_039289 [Senna tora]|uniref:Uncharacterized protein n=1 Tax=Senna tora TaxID=362788 RepID=A0A834SMH3_9FABA|nr:uncharacterized protein G2W53_039289 [Senna tora]